MNPDQNSTNWSLPQPVSPESPQSSPLPSEGDLAQQVASARELMPMPVPSTVPSPQISMTVPGMLPGPAQGATTGSQTATDPLTTPSLAADVDLIEKEWVDKAKRIVEATREDPYQQTKQLAQAKAAYLQQRYHKTIKVAEE